MAAWRKIIVSGSNAELSSVTGSFTGSFTGTVEGTIASSSVSINAQTASVALRANALAPTVTATSASTAVNAQTASVALRANALAPTVTATSASVAARATTLSPAATASFADLASDARTATSASIAALASTLSSTATASIADTATSASRAASGDGLFSGSFSGSFQGDGSDLTGLATTLTVDGDSGTQDVSLTADDLQILGTANEITTAITKVGNDVKATLSLPDDVTIGQDITISRNASVGGNLIVNGSIVSASSLAVADQFIILASGSNGAIDGGIIINQIDDDPDGKGQAFAYDSSANRWALETGLNDSASVITPDAFMGVIQEGTSAPSTAPVYGAANGFGTVFVNSNDGNIYIWS